MDRWLLQGVALDEPFSAEKEATKGACGEQYYVHISGATCTAWRMLDTLKRSVEAEWIAETDELPLVRRLEEECELLSKIPHPNIVQFIGTHLPNGADPKDKLLVTENLRMNLNELITRYPVIPLAFKLHVLRDVASGLLHLHSRGLTHGGITAASVLLTGDVRAKVFDMGVVRVVDEYFTAAKGTQRKPPNEDYVPPEALSGKTGRGNKVDSFAFGHLALYLIIQEYPEPTAAATTDQSSDTCEAAECSEVRRRRKWIEKIRAGNQQLRAMVEKCLQDQPFHRPAMADIHGWMARECERQPRRSSPTMARLLETKQASSDIGSLEAEMQQLFPGVLGSHATETSSATVDISETADVPEISPLDKTKHRQGAGFGKHLDVSVIVAGLNEKKELLNLARLAEDAKRFEDMMEVMKTVMDEIIETGKLMELEERTMLGVAFKNVVAPRRAAWRSVKQKLAPEGENPDVNSKYLQAIGQEILTCCDDILKRLEKYPIDADSADNQIFLHKMKGDYLRYQAEVMDRSSSIYPAILEKSELSFLKAVEIAKKTAKPSNMLRMAASFNLSVFYFEVHRDAKKAISIAREIVELASADIEASKTEDNSESALLVQMIQEHLKVWTTKTQQTTYESPV